MQPRCRSGFCFVLFFAFPFWVHSVPISTRMIRRRKDPALLKLPWNSFDNRGTEHKLSHGDLSQTRCDSGQSLASPVQRTRGGSELCKGKCKQVEVGEKEFTCRLIFHDKSPHRVEHLSNFFLCVCRYAMLNKALRKPSPCICIVSWVCSSKTAAAGRPSNCDRAETDGMKWTISHSG